MKMILRCHTAILVGLLSAWSFSAVAAAKPQAADELDRCNVVWTTPGKDAGDSMPLGNGQVGINLWVEAGGDLHFYISRTDSLSEISRLLKVGKVRVSISPNPFAAGLPFQQELRLREGRCEITAGEGDKKVTLSVFVDADRPVVYVVGESASPVSVKATIESWRTARHVVARGDEQLSAWTVREALFEIAESPDVFPGNLGDEVAWYHRNQTSVCPLTLKHQGLAAAADKVRDPLLHRTFGGWIAAAGFKAVNRARWQRRHRSRHSPFASPYPANRRRMQKPGWTWPANSPISRPTLRKPCSERRRGGGRSRDDRGSSSTAISS